MNMTATPTPTNPNPIMAVLNDGFLCLYTTQLNPAVRTVASFLGATTLIRTPNPVQTRDNALNFLAAYDTAIRAAIPDCEDQPL